MINKVLFKVSNGLDPDQDRHAVGLDLGPNGLLRLSVDDENAASMDSVNVIPHVNYSQHNEGLGGGDNFFLILFV